MTNLSVRQILEKSLPTPSSVFILDEYTIEIWDARNTIRSNVPAVTFFYLVYDKQRNLKAKGRAHGMGMDFQYAATKKAFDAIGVDYHYYQWCRVAPNSNTFVSDKTGGF